MMSQELSPKQMQAAKAIAISALAIREEIGLSYAEMVAIFDELRQRAEEMLGITDKPEGNTKFEDFFEEICAELFHRHNLPDPRMMIAEDSSLINLIHQQYHSGGDSSDVATEVNRRLWPKPNPPL